MSKTAATPTTTLARFEQIRDELIANYENEVAHGADARIVAIYTDAINAMHDAISDLEDEQKFAALRARVGNGDWNDKSSRWHY